MEGGLLYEIVSGIDRTFVEGFSTGVAMLTVPLSAVFLPSYIAGNIEHEEMPLKLGNYLRHTNESERGITTPFYF